MPVKLEKIKTSSLLYIIKTFKTKQREIQTYESLVWVKDIF